MKRRIAAVAALVVCAVPLMAALPASANVAEDYAAITPAFALHAAGLASVGFQNYFAQREPLVIGRRSVDAGQEISRLEDVKITRVGPCTKAHIAPFTCRQESAYSIRSAFMRPGEATTEALTRECKFVYLRIGKSTAPVHRTKRSNSFALVRSRFDVHLKRFGFVTVESPPEYSSCGQEETPIP